MKLKSLLAAAAVLMAATSCSPRAQTDATGELSSLAATNQNANDATPTKAAPSPESLQQSNAAASVPTTTTNQN